MSRKVSGLKKNIEIKDYVFVDYTMLSDTEQEIALNFRNQNKEWMINKEIIELEEHKKWIKIDVSKRGDKTIIFPCSDASLYLQLVNDKKQFRCQVLVNINSSKNVCGHKPGCKANRGYSFNGFRANDRKTITEGGQKQEFSIRMCRCNACGQRFSLLPSFLPREKHFGIESVANSLDYSGMAMSDICRHNSAGQVDPLVAITIAYQESLGLLP